MFAVLKYDMVPILSTVFKAFRPFMIPFLNGCASVPPRRPLSA
jgi:hypothetical protein